MPAGVARSGSISTTNFFFQFPWKIEEEVFKNYHKMLILILRYWHLEYFLSI